MVDHLGSRKNLSVHQRLWPSSVGVPETKWMLFQTRKRHIEWREKKIALSNQGKSSAASLDELLSKVKIHDRSACDYCKLTPRLC